MPVERGYLVRSMLGFSPCRMPVTRRVRPECIEATPAPSPETPKGRAAGLVLASEDATMGPKRRGDRLGKGGPCRFLEPGAGEIMRGMVYSTVERPGGAGLTYHGAIEANERAQVACS